MAAWRPLIDTLKGRRATLGDQRVRAYFDSVLFQSAVDFRGADRNGATSPSGSALSVLSGTRLANSFRQPVVTAAENSLWLAEAQARSGADGPALAALNQAKAATSTSNGVAVPAATGLTGSALLNEIKMEEWISLFQNIEAWNAYKGTAFRDSYQLELRPTCRDVCSTDWPSATRIPTYRLPHSSRHATRTIRRRAATRRIHDAPAAA